ncbi:MAG: bifunctional metallophosphatase/5'-nucleotidase [Bacteroidetes bacterium HGW-Bacteroidetes-4]|jgi:2',3'-cyclic-nucleotide 2'-phosphodiesterase/3'-nucleotidase|nr:MAG: bifunctional metallophosphatase/5'-nucleotidase [Bacteroidetes bacterium HGW-Bacteroidetes-4]
MKLINTFLRALVLSLFIASCSQKPAEVTINLIQSTDIHGTLFPYDFIEQKEMTNSLASVYTYVKEVRSNNPDGVVLLDNGDYLQGQPTVYYYNFEDTVSSHLGADIFNYMRYDAAVVGNHDIETGHSVYDRFRKEIKMAYMAANAINTKTGESYFDAYTIIERQGIKIAVLGMITPGIPNWLPESLWSGIEFADMIETAKKWIPIIQEKENPDLIIGLFHSGIDHTYNNNQESTYLNENATRLVAEQVPGFDIVMAGHDHKKFNEKIVNVNGDTVILLDPRSHARAVASVKIQFTYNKKEKKYHKIIHPSIVDVEQYAPDSLFMAQFSEPFNKVKTYVSRQIGTFSHPIDSKDAYFGNSAFIDLIHQVQLEVSQADISFTSPLSFRTKIKQGPVYVSDLFKLYKYENLLYTIHLTGKEIDAYLEYSCNLWFNQMKNKNDHLLKIEKNEQGYYRLSNQYYNFSSASGIDYLVDVSKPFGKRVKILGLTNGTNFYSDSTFSVAVNSYRGNGGGGHLTDGAGLLADELRNRLVNSTPFDLRYYLMKWIEKEQTVDAVKASNWRIIPEDYFENGKRKDMKLLFEEH